MKEPKLTLQDAKLIHKDLTSKIKEYDIYYYEKNAPIISDAEYDQLVLWCKDLEDQFPSLTINSPLSKVAGKASPGFAKVQHKVPMLSLSNIFHKEEVEEFVTRVQKFLKIDYFPKIIGELKIDGLSFSAIYKRGVLEVCASRGDGKIGEDITENVKSISNFPHIIDNEDEVLEVRGEIYITKEDFARLNQTQQSQGKQIFANPRNAAAGSLRNLDIEVTRSRPLKYFAYSTGFANEDFARDQSHLLKKLEKLGFCVNSARVEASSCKELLDFYDKYESEREDLAYEIDGIVYKIDNFELCNRLGTVGRTPRWATAHKFPAYLATTILKDIKIQVGRTGALTPVAILEPVNIAGATITRASLHNFDEIVRKDVRIGDLVSLKRAGDVIPQIDSVVIEQRPASAKEFTIPDLCPSCGALVVKNTEDAVIRCNNGLNCQDQILERLIHFVSKECFNIDGLGKKQVIFLFEKNYIKTPVDIFDLPTDKEKSMKLAREEQWGELSVNNLLESIKKSSFVTLDRFIFALGIRHVGAITAKTLAKLYKTYDRFIEEMKRIGANDPYSIENINNQDGFGYQTTASLIEFWQIEDNISLSENLSTRLIFTEQEEVLSSLTDKIIVFTGSLMEISRNEAKAVAEKYGAKVTSSVTSKTDFVVAGEKAGSKLQDAIKHGVKILTEAEWIEMIKSL